MEKKDLIKVPCKNTEKIEYEDIDEETIVFNLETNYFYKLNSIASQIWDNIDGKKSIEEIVKYLNSIYEESETKIEKDTLVFFKQLHKNKMIFFQN